MMGHWWGHREMVRWGNHFIHFKHSKLEASQNIDSKYNL